MTLGGLDYERILDVALNHQMRFVLIGGLNYFLHFRPVTTLDVDLFVDPTLENITSFERALTELNASWGLDDDDRGPVAEKQPGWLASQSVYCLLTDSGPLNIFARLPGVPDFSACFERSALMTTSQGLTYRSMIAEDMLACQLALPESERKLDRVRHLQAILRGDR